MNIIIFMLTLVAASIIIVRGVYVAAHLDIRSWHGHRLRYLGLVLSFGLLCGGSLGVALMWPPAVPIFLTGVAGYFLFNRRDR